MADREIRPIRIEGNIAYVTLTKGYTSIIDAADVPLICSWNWLAQVLRRPDGTIKTVYAVRNHRVAGKQRTTMMHRQLAQTPAGLETDHIDSDGLNNRRANLRYATRQQNAHNQRAHSHNTSGVKGVNWHKQTGRWQARIRLAGKERHLGLFHSLEAAAEAYAAASAELHGRFGRTS